MNKLNLPPYAIALDRQDETLKVWDDLRRKWVRLTPEEWVRQHFIHFLIDHLGYPAQLLGNEVGLSLGGSNALRCSLSTKPLAYHLVSRYLSKPYAITTS